jgi:hypothetical protein
MHSTFVTELKSNGGPGTAIRTASGTIPAHVQPPADSLSKGTSASVFVIPSPEPKIVQARVASAVPSSIGAFFGQLFSSKRDNPTAMCTKAH